MILKIGSYICIKISSECTTYSMNIVYLRVSIVYMSVSIVYMSVSIVYISPALSFSAHTRTNQLACAMGRSLEQIY